MAPTQGAQVSAREWLRLGSTLGLQETRALPSRAPRGQAIELDSDLPEQALQGPRDLLLPRPLRALGGGEELGLEGGLFVAGEAVTQVEEQAKGEADDEEEEEGEAWSQGRFP